LDYGYYVELITIAKAPKGLFPSSAAPGTEDDEAEEEPDLPLEDYEYRDVPIDHYKAIGRRCLRSAISPNVGYLCSHDTRGGGCRLRQTIMGNRARGHHAPR
jgi:hypothetical protein